MVIAYVDIAITSTRFQHYEVEGDVAGYGGRIGGDWYYKDKQKTTDHRLVAISAPLQFALTSFALGRRSGKRPCEKPCYELVSDAIRQGVLPPEKAGLLSVLRLSRRNVPHRHRPFFQPRRIADREQRQGEPPCCRQTLAPGRATRRGRG